ncbi:hypothetical protein BJY04DRAFT_194812 [Aspergillus karnatakaensis]|uniref:uncharacterized protein n=1 Tax=Aspergillus karnatakaensis TaxID=1810916 RepID=UPI003CCD7352
MNTLISLLLLSALHLSAAAGTCDYNNPTNCINVQTKATRSFAFDNLFTKNATFVYAIDSISSNVQKTAFWLEYPVLHTNNEARNLTQVAMLFTNASSASNGGNNGCNGIISDQCAENLKDALRWGIIPNVYEQQNQSLPNALKELTANPPRNLSCPVDLFDDSALTSTWNTSDSVTRPFAVEWVERIQEYIHSEHLPSGSANQTYSFPVDRKRSYETQLAKAGVGIVVRAPVYVEPVYNSEEQEYQGERLVDFDEIEIEFVCLKASDDEIENAGDGGDGSDHESASGSDDSPEDNDNAGVRASVAVFPAVLGALVAMML